MSDFKISPDVGIPKRAFTALYIGSSRRTTESLFIIKKESMQKELLLEMIAQNQTTCWAGFNEVTVENAPLRLNEQAASIGFIYRHVAETMNLFGLFLGLQTEVQNSTMGQQDEGQGQDVEASRQLLERGYTMLQDYVSDAPDSAWLEPIETPFFGTVTRIRLFSHVLYHNAYHAGQIGLTLKRGKRIV